MRTDDVLSGEKVRVNTDVWALSGMQKVGAGRGKAVAYGEKRRLLRRPRVTLILYPRQPARQP